MKNNNNSYTYDGDPYLKITNQLLGAIINSKNLLTHEGKIFILILFKTLAFQKEADWLTYKQICKLTGIKQKTRISESIKNLLKKKQIIKDGKYFKVNQDFEKWLTLDSENINSIKEFYHYKKLQNIVTGVMEKHNSKLQKSVMPSTDKTITDKTITDNNIYSQDNVLLEKQIKEIINYLNIKTNKNFSTSIKSTIKDIKSRLNEGFTVKDFKSVIDVKTSSWINTEYDKYLRPETLFRNKFESYLNEKIIIDNNKRSIKHFTNEREYTDEERRKIENGFYSQRQ